MGTFAVRALIVCAALPDKKALTQRPPKPIGHPELAVASTLTVYTTNPARANTI